MALKLYIRLIWAQRTGRRISTYPKPTNSYPRTHSLSRLKCMVLLHAYEYTYMYRYVYVYVYVHVLYCHIY